MKTIGKTTAVLVLTLILGATATAQDYKSQKDKDPEVVASEMTARLDKALDLSDNQEAEIQGIIIKSVQEGKELHKELNESSREEHKARMDEHRKATDEKIMAVLNDEQQMKFEKLNQEKEQRRAEHEAIQKLPPDEAAEKMIGKLDEQVGLSADQKKDLEPLLTEHVSQMRELKDSEMSKEEKRQRSNELRREMDAQFKKVLTEEQYKKHKENRPPKHGHH
jgi:Spy/CpxP family protein refolding chaperone